MQAVYYLGFLFLGAAIGAVLASMILEVAWIGTLRITDTGEKDIYRFEFREIAKIRKYRYALMKIAVEKEDS